MGRTFACSDLHGFYSIYKKINEFLKPDDMVYFLGDAADRGPNGWKILKDLPWNDQWYWIMGNHDEMLYDRVYSRDWRYSISVHENNGGHMTWQDAEQEPELLNEVANHISLIPRYATYTNKDGKVIFMSHSGATNTLYPNDLVWDRSHYFYPIDKETEPYDVIIHGHTPIFYMIDDMKGYKDIELTPYNLDKPCAYWYQNGTKCNLDNLTICSGATVLLDLDTFEEHIFTVSGNEEVFVERGVF